METNSIGKKSIVLWMALLLILGLIFPITVFSSAVKYDDDGVWFDTFEDFTNISDNKSCVLSNGSIRLDRGNTTHHYDFNDSKNHEAWEAKYSSIIFNANSELIRLKNLLDERPITTDGHKVLNDSKILETQGDGYDFELLNLTFTFSPIHHFRFKTNQNRNNIVNFNFSWWYGSNTSDANIDSIQLYVWNYSALLGVGLWINEGEAVNGSICLTSDTIGYVGDDGCMDFLIVAIPDEHGENCILKTDYVNLTINTKYGYLEDGHAVSTEIIPTNLGRWESIIWSSSRATNISYVKIQVLDKDGNLIANSTLPGNQEGFTSSPLDLSRLPNSIDRIKINASLHSSDLSITPRLHSWCVTWQTENNRFYDSFTTDVRLDKVAGANIVNGKINISDVYGDWPIFGRTPENTRAYEGDGPNKNEHSLYWYTKSKTVGGGLRSPVMSDEVIYVASSVDGKIYAFNATVPSSEKGKELREFYSSNSSYIVDSSVAVADDLVIVATSEINASNKIYALNKTNLDEKWNYSYSNGPICFSSAPTISDEKIFVTSWNGIGWTKDTNLSDLWSFLYSMQDANLSNLLSFLYSIINGNNKIIALNLIDGTEIWTADLPAGSFSTPAVADGMVFVGCDSILGSNLFAFDEETGVEIWNAGVGLIGGASPVVYNDKVFIVVKEQNILSLKGDIKVVALDENNGTILWNKTILENVSSFEGLPKGLGLYYLMATSTPAVYETDQGVSLFISSPDGKLHALDITDGEKIWSIDLLSSAYDLIPIPCTSPVVAHDQVYVALANGIVHAVNMLGENSWDFDCKTEDQGLFNFTPAIILSSPIVADGVLYVSATVAEDLETLGGRIYSIGNYTPNRRAKVISNPIHVPQSYWWDEFNAVCENINNTAGSTIKFSILDANDEVLESNLNGTHNDISNIGSNVIRLCAEFERVNKSQDPTLHSWSVTWVSEGNPPVFNDSSFTPNLSGWINESRPTCSINVRDVADNDVISGLDISSAEYNLEYVPEGSNESVTGSFKAKCDDTNGVIETTLRAIISDLEINISELSITFSIKDLAGNEATSNPKTFKIDTIEPISNIKNISDFSDTSYNESINITAEASDPGDPSVNKSGIKTVTLCYRYSIDDENWGDWEEFDTAASLFNWSFGNDTTNSSYYEFRTIAADNAGNKENETKAAEVSFIFDMKEPAIETNFTDEYRFNELPKFSIAFSDDFKLDTIYYRPNFETEWTLIDSGINESEYDSEWTLLQEHWDYMTEGDEYYIHFRITDICENKYETPSNAEALKIIKDLNVSKVHLDLSDFQEWHWDNVFTISANIPEDYEGNIVNVSLCYRYSADNEKWNEWKQYGDNLTSPPFEWEFIAEEGSGYYKFKTKVLDAAGKVSESPVESISVTLFPTILIIMISLAIILIVIAVFILVKIKNKKV